MSGGQHVPKSKRQYEYYARAIQKIEAEPTISNPNKLPESSNATRSDSNKVDFVSDTKPRRKKSFWKKLTKQWKPVVVGVFTTIATVFFIWILVDSRVAIDVIKSDITKNEKNIDSLDSKIEKTMDKFIKFQIETIRELAKKPDRDFRK